MHVGSRSNTQGLHEMWVVDPIRRGYAVWCTQGLPCDMYVDSRPNTYGLHCDMYVDIIDPIRMGYTVICM